MSVFERVRIDSGRAEPPAPTRDELEQTRSRLAETRRRAVAWVTAHVADDGQPDGAEVANSWWRAPWALCVSGAPDVAAAILSWAERNALTDDGDLREGPFRNPAPDSPVYHLSPIAIAAWLLGRYDVAGAVMGTLAGFQDRETGGAYEYREFANDRLQDMLKTGQLGVAGLVTGHRETVAGVRQWLETVYDAQPDLPSRLFTSWRDALVTDFAPEEGFSRVLEFQSARQAYFQPGIAAAFLAGQAGQGTGAGAIELGRKYLALTKGGAEVQFSDRSSVQICKFGWGAAAMEMIDPEGGHLPWVLKMADWFTNRQNPDGSWNPSSFMTPRPGLLDRLWKTTEHLMEVSYIEQTLTARLAA